MAAIIGVCAATEAVATVAAAPIVAIEAAMAAGIYAAVIAAPEATAAAVDTPIAVADAALVVAMLVTLAASTV